MPCLSKILTSARRSFSRLRLISKPAKPESVQRLQRSRQLWPRLNPQSPGVETAELNLDYTRILAPVTGRISRQHVTSGNLVSGGTATSTLLTTITSVDPIYCTFDANEQDVLKYTRLALAGKRESSRVAKNPVFLGLIDEAGFPHEGTWISSIIDLIPDTASMRARCVFHNDDRVLVPGMFARIRIPGSAAYDGVLIPDAAIGTDQSTQFVYIVANDVVERRAVTPGPMIDGLRVVRKGLTGNESVVIEGLLQARPGFDRKDEQRFHRGCGRRAAGHLRAFAAGNVDFAGHLISQSETVPSAMLVRPLSRERTPREVSSFLHRTTDLRHGVVVHHCAGGRDYVLLVAGLAVPCSRPATDRRSSQLSRCHAAGHCRYRRDSDRTGNERRR